MLVLIVRCEYDYYVMGKDEDIGYARTLDNAGRMLSEIVPIIVRKFFHERDLTVL